MIAHAETHAAPAVAETYRFLTERCPQVDGGSLCGRDYPRRMTLGSFADLITALAAVAALFAAIAAARHARQLFGIEAKRDEAAAARERQTQASKVFAWVASRIGEETTYGVVVVNSSDQAIYDVHVRATDANSKERGPIALTILPPGAYYLGESSKSYAWEFASRLRSFDDEIRPVTKSKKRRIMAMSFRDSSNLLWKRDEAGNLEPA